MCACSICRNWRSKMIFIHILKYIAIIIFYFEKKDLIFATSVNLYFLPSNHICNETFILTSVNLVKLKINVYLVTLEVHCEKWKKIVQCTMKHL